MKILGDINSATKFYILNTDESIEWVPSLGIAKAYTNDPQNKNWYNKTIYATNEDFILAPDNKIYLKSNAPKKINKLTPSEIKNTFINQAELYIEYKLTNTCKKNENKTFDQILSWYNSKLINKKNLAKKYLSFRDNLYICLETYIKNYFENENTINKDNSEVYSKFIEDIDKVMP